MDSLTALSSLLASIPWIKDFRVVRETDSHSTIQFVVDGSHSAEEIAALLRDRAPRLAAGIEPLVVPHLAPQPAGTVTESAGPVAMCGTDVVPGLSELPRTLPEALRRAAQSELVAAITHVEADGSAKSQTFADLLAEAEAVCGGLLQSGCQRGDRAIILPNGSAEALPAFWGCLLAGLTPVVAQIPQTFQGANRGLDQLAHVWKLLEGPILIGGHALTETARLLSARLGVDDVRLAEIESLRQTPRVAQVEPVDVDADATAFYSLTSGSMGVPKCIALTHGNIIQRAHGANLACDHSRDDVILNWLPFDHIGSLSDWHLRCVLLGCRMVYAGKESVIGRPLLWLDLIDKYRITHTWAPNFAYALICDRLAKLGAEGQPLPAWDLSCVGGMLTAGESISHNAVERFLADLAPFGLPATAIRPAFGMAELGSGITYRIARTDRPLKFHSIERASLNGRVIPTSADREDASTFASLGPPIPGVSIRIVNDDRRPVSEGTVGHLEVRGAVVSPGYLHNPEANRVFHADGWFESGDLGFLAEGELVITGRAKESIIIRGMNFSCSEIEELVDSVPDVEPGFTAAFSIRRPEVDREELY